MVTFVNTKDPSVSFRLLPWFVPADQDKVEIGAELEQRLKNSPDDTWVDIATEDGSVCGMVIGFKREEDVYVWQAKILPGFKCGKEMMRRITAWAKESGFSKLAARPLREDALKRRFGFKGHGLLIKEI
jgi:hypothetical protein